MAKKVNDGLLPCPFCGGEAWLVSEPTFFGVPLLWIAECQTCGNKTAKHVSDHDAKEAWNRRKEKQETL